MPNTKKEQIISLEEDIASLIKSLKKVDERNRLNTYPILYALFCDIMARAASYFPDNETFFTVALKTLNTPASAEGYLYQTYQIIEREKKIESSITENKLFLGAEDKLKIAGISFQNGDYSSTFNNLNTALELILKDILGIPTTITKINTSDIINILVKEGVGPIQHLKEVQKHILSIDNKIKHQGYNPSKIDSINAIKAMEDLLSQLNKVTININEEIKEKILNKL